ncbi:MAG: hypothetical protein L3J18_05770 [Candidatus Brocadia sp.]|nr:MAG: hypothetical protein L3J18_05770 [Candidatus Brocadia sp.]
MKFMNLLNAYLWGAPMIIAIIGVGVFLTILSRFIQMRRFLRTWRETFVRTFRGEGGRALKYGIPEWLKISPLRA